jgi:hypothetical protein
MGIYAEVGHTSIKLSGLLAEVLHDRLPHVAAYRQPEITRAQLRDVVIPEMCTRVESGLPLRREDQPNLQDIWGLRNDLTSLAALVEWVAQPRPDDEALRWS